MLSFALTRCKDVVTHEVFMSVQSLFDGADNGSIQTSLDDLDKDLGKLKRFGVALSNLQFGYLKTEIDKVYLQLNVIPFQTQTTGFSDDELNEVIETICAYLKDAEFAPEDGKYYMPVREFEELFADSDLSPGAIRKVLLERGYIEGSNGRTSTLKKLDNLFDLMGWEDSGYAFISLNDGEVTKAGGQIMPDVLSKWFSRFLEKYELPKITLHEVRHTSISYLINRGVDVKMVADRAGHQNTRTTEEIYSHIFAKTRRATANEYDGLFSSRVAER